MSGPDTEHADIDKNGSFVRTIIPVDGNGKAADVFAVVGSYKFGISGQIPDKGAFIHKA